MLLKNEKKRYIMRDELLRAIIPLKNEAKEIVDYTIVDDEFWHELMEFKWTLNDGYAIFQRNGKSIRMHRYLVNGEIIDHCNNHRLDNRICNLRSVTTSENAHNRIKSPYTSSKYSGVSYHNIAKCWRTHINKDNRRYYIGSYKTEDSAAVAFNEAATKFYGNKARLNIIGESSVKQKNKIFVNKEVVEENQNHYNNQITDMLSNIVLNEKRKQSSKYRGVVKYNIKWIAQINYKKTHYYLGIYDDVNEAARAYNKKAKELLGDKAILNIIEEDIPSTSAS
jgi:hypothetical protein